MSVKAHRSFLIGGSTLPSIYKITKQLCEKSQGFFYITKKITKPKGELNYGKTKERNI